MKPLTDYDGFPIFNVAFKTDPTVSTFRINKSGHSMLVGDHSQ